MSETCDRRYHPPYLTGTIEQTGMPYWWYCKRPPGHSGDCDCQAAHEYAAEAGFPDPPIAPDTKLVYD
jgi:hypothetical protein